MHPARLETDVLLRECQLRRTRRSGPGGQHRNKVETAVVIRHLATGIEGQASERRSQSENHQVAVMRLRVNLAIQLRKPVETPYQPSDLWKRYCPGGRIHINPANSDFPSLVAEALDILDALNYQVSGAAGELKCTNSQLVKFLAVEPRVLVAVNEQRKSLGMNNLKH